MLVVVGVLGLVPGTLSASWAHTDQGAAHDLTCTKSGTGYTPVDCTTDHSIGGLGATGAFKFEGHRTTVGAGAGWSLYRMGVTTGTAPATGQRVCLVASQDDTGRKSYFAFTSAAYTAGVEVSGAILTMGQATDGPTYTGQTHTTRYWWFTAQGVCDATNDPRPWAEYEGNGEPPPDPEEGEGCGGFWNFFCQIGQALSDFFLPDTADLEATWDVLSDAATGHYPLGPVTWVAGTLYTAGQEFTDGTNATEPDFCPGFGPTLVWEDIFGHDIGEDSATIPLIPGTGTECPASTSGILGDLQGTSFWISSFLILLGTVLFIWKAVIAIFGGGSGDAGD